MFCLGAAAGKPCSLGSRSMQAVVSLGAAAGAAGAACKPCSPRVLQQAQQAQQGLQGQRRPPAPSLAPLTTVPTLVPPQPPGPPLPWPGSPAPAPAAGPGARRGGGPRPACPQLRRCVQQPLSRNGALSRRGSPASSARYGRFWVTVARAALFDRLALSHKCAMTAAAAAAS